MIAGYSMRKNCPLAHEGSVKNGFYYLSAVSLKAYIRMSIRRE